MSSIHLLRHTHTFHIYWWMRDRAAYFEMQRSKLRYKEKWNIGKSQFDRFGPAYCPCRMLCMRKCNGHALLLRATNRCVPYIIHMLSHSSPTHLDNCIDRFVLFRFDFLVCVYLTSNIIQNMNPFVDLFVLAHFPESVLFFCGCLCVYVCLFSWLLIYWERSKK